MARRTVSWAAARLSGLVAVFFLSIPSLACYVTHPVEPPGAVASGVEVRVTYRNSGDSARRTGSDGTRTVEGRVLSLQRGTLVLLTRNGLARSDTLRLNRENLVRVEQKELHLGKTVGLAAGTVVGLGVGALLILSGDASGRGEVPIGDEPVDATKLLWP